MLEHLALSDLPPGTTIVVEGPGRNDWAEHPCDVIVLVKRFASDANLSQATCCLWNQNVYTKVWCCAVFI